MRFLKVIVDTGPIVAYLNKNDKYHEWTVAQFAQTEPPLFTCESVLSEACFLVRHFQDGAANILKLLERRLLNVRFNFDDEISATKDLLNKYKNIPISLADACLVRMSEQINGSVIFTLDSEFKIYRKNKRNIIPTIMPSD
ncbi:MAG: pilus assembly protein [Candidatus Schekmanbacteria bacterium RBG_13_48_7]|uniref:Pilus assembly protein n=1 Tax=Candidatus Schekmanbacteria bacterium RBG_13_48_7 TaxID=1817878 RepID=A0A1F7S0A1_9BACT|nr:MAG: pilus assembly protein [Candidatus Schekmanbacteria bacterium RBG_13_48_7]